jgi:hypothetical protein
VPAVALDDANLRGGPSPAAHVSRAGATSSLLGALAITGVGIALDVDLLIAIGVVFVVVFLAGELWFRRRVARGRRWLKATTAVDG